jgi:hypothetical protein
MNPKKLQKAVALAAADVAKLKLGGWSLGVMGRELEAISYQDAAASTLRGLLQSSGRDEAVRIVEEEPESFALLVREAPIWLQAMAGTYGRECDLVLEDEG